MVKEVIGHINNSSLDTSRLIVIFILCDKALDVIAEIAKSLIG